LTTTRVVIYCAADRGVMNYPNRRIRIGEAARVLGVSVQTLRRWDRLGELHVVGRTEGGHRLYQVGKLMFIKEEIFMRSHKWFRGTRR